MAAVEQIGVVEARILRQSVPPGPRHTRRPVPVSFMHRTEPIDYGIVLAREITQIMNQGEKIVRAGDIIIQCGTNRAWANRSDRNCRIAFIVIDGEFAPELRQ